MVKCMYRNKKDDTALRDKIQDAMNAIGWNDKAKMDGADGSGSDTAAGSQLVVRDLSDSRKDEGLWDDVISHHPTIV